MSPQLPTIGELFARTWTQYKQRALPVLAVVLIGTALVSTLLLAVILGGFIGGAVLLHLTEDLTGIAIIAGVSTFFILAIIVALIWCQTALLAIVVDDELGIIEAFQRGWEYLWPMTWVLTFLAGILTTGFIFGVLPGFLFLVWFSFCAFIMLEEDRRGLDTLLASREYVRGFGWDTFAKMVVVWLISAAAGIIPLLGQAISILLTPFLLLYLLNMFRDLKAVKGTVELKSGNGSRIFWWLVTIIGLLLPIAGLLALLYFLFMGEQALMPPPSWHGSGGISL